MPEQLVLLAELDRDLGTPAVGSWAVELAGRGIEVVRDDLGRLAVDRSSARDIYAEHFEAEARTARKRAELERQAIERDQAFRNSLPAGVSVGSVPEGLTAGMLMMLADPEHQRSRRQSVLEHALEHPAGAVVFTPVREES